MQYKQMKFNSVVELDEHVILIRNNSTTAIPATRSEVVIYLKWLEGERARMVREERIAHARRSTLRVA